MSATPIRAAHARRTETPNAFMTTLASPSQGPTEHLSMWLVDMRAGQQGPPHFYDAEQIWHLLEGDVMDDADSGHDAAADDEIGPVGDQWRQLEERRVTVDQELDPLAGEQPAALMVPAEVPFAAAQARLLEQAFDLGQLLGHGGPVRAVGVGPGIDLSRQDGHACTLTCARVS